MTIGWQALLFAVPGILIYGGVYYLTPWLVRREWPLVTAFWLCLWTPALLLLPCAVLFPVVLEGTAFSWHDLLQRFRLVPLVWTDWGWIGAAIVVTVVSEQVLEPISKYLARTRLLAPPSYLPAPFNPLRKFSIPPRHFFGVPLRGNWKLLCVFIPLHLLAMFSEELMWRGYLLPLQEAQFGLYAWVINGMMWAWLMHVVLKWHFAAMIPGMLAAPLAAQLVQSTWASFAVHAISNAPLWVLLLLGIMVRT